MFYDLNGAAQRAGLSKRHFLRSLTEDKIETFTIHRKKFIRGDLLNAWIQKRRLRSH
jgi:hypothetical protein